MVVSFPWQTKEKVPPGATCVALLGVVSLASISMLPAFVRFGFKIDRQMMRTPGMLAYRTGWRVGGLAFYHLSAWSSQEAIHDFVETKPHLDAMEQLTGKLGETTFRYWTVTGADLPLHLRNELHRLQGDHS